MFSLATRDILQQAFALRLKITNRVQENQIILYSNDYNAVTTMPNPQLVSGTVSGTVDNILVKLLPTRAYFFIVLTPGAQHYIAPWRVHSHP